MNPILRKNKICCVLAILAGALVALPATMASTINVVDLTVGYPAMGSVNNGGYVFAINPQSTGTGVIQPFLREHANVTEQGINTSIAKPPYDDKPGPWTHDLPVNALATVTYNSNSYYEFLLDANQVSNGDISLINFKIYVTQGSPYTTNSDLINLVNTVTPSYDMNGSTTGYRVDISSQNGSGSGDMYFLVPMSAIGTTGNLYLYAQFGQELASNGSTGYVSNDGFEEWYAKQSRRVPDSGATVALLGLALLGLAAFRRRMVRN